jgi:hypothetical protein
MRKQALSNMGTSMGNPMQTLGSASGHPVTQKFKENHDT